MCCRHPGPGIKMLPAARHVARPRRGGGMCPAELRPDPPARPSAGPSLRARVPWRAMDGVCRSDVRARGDRAPGP